MNTLLWIFLTLIALWMALRYLPTGADRHRPLVELIALIDLLSAPLLVLLVWAILIQAWPQTALALVELTLVSIWHLGYRTGSGPAPASLNGDGGSSPVASLSVMTLNCRYGKADPQSIVDHVRRHHIDILALQEVDSSLLNRLEKAGLRATLPHLVEGAPTEVDNGGRNVLFSRTTPEDLHPAAIDLEASSVPTMRVNTEAGPVRLASVHPRSPQRGARQWGLGIERLARINGAEAPTGEATSEDRPGTEPAFTIIMGDCNANIHHPTFRSMLTAGNLRDASLSLGRGLHPTFPYQVMGLPPLIEIDHILISQGIRVGDLRAIGVPGTDHRGLVADLILP